MDQEYQRVWDECLGFIRDNLTGKEGENAFITWFKPIVPVKLDGTTLIIQVPSQFFYEWLEQNYADVLEDAIRLTLGPTARLQYSIVMVEHFRLAHHHTHPLHWPPINTQPSQRCAHEHWS